jgi:DNA modification methylase
LKGDIKIKQFNKTVIDNSTLYLGDCLDISNIIKDNSIDLILTDPPYGSMKGQAGSGIYHKGEERHNWDNKIESKIFFDIAKRILRKNGKMILFSQEPYTSELILESKNDTYINFNYKAIWLKNTLGSFMRSKKALLYRTEDILIFSKNNPKYDLDLKNPIRKWIKKIQDESNIYYNDNRIHKRYVETGLAKNIESAKVTCMHLLDWNYNQLQKITKKHYKVLSEFFSFDKSVEEISNIYDKYQKELLLNESINYPCIFNLQKGTKYKDNVFQYGKDPELLHPTQKPVTLLEDLIKTYSNENNIIVDLTMGSGSTKIACINTNRKFIGIEKDEKYFEIAKNRKPGGKKEVFKKVSNSLF